MPSGSQPGHGALPALDGNPLLDAWRDHGPLSRSHPERLRLVRRYAYGIPTDRVIEEIARASPGGVVEVGAGTGYWARLLHEAGVDVVALDRWPPPSPRNRFVDPVEPWFPVRRAPAAWAGRFPDRTLLLVWPTWDEPWPAGALRRYHAAGGRAVVYVGEGPGGLTGDDVFHRLLDDHQPCLACSLGVVDAPCQCEVHPLWELVQRIEVPQWSGAEDACAVYRRAAVARPPQRPPIRWWPGHRVIRPD